MGKLVLTKKPPLNAPYLVAGFAGWPDGGGVSTGVVDFLTSYLAAERIGEITLDDMYINSSPALASRPIVTVKEGLIHSLYFPGNEFFAWQNQGGAHDLVLLQGIEPDLHWQQFVEALLECIQIFEVERVYTIGGYLDYAPHTRVPRVHATVTHKFLQEELRQYDVDFNEYEGPTSIQAYLLSHCQERGIEGIGLWGGTPSYIQGSYPKVAHAMLCLLSEIWHLPFELGTFEEQLEELESSLHEQIDSSPELADYIKHLEQAYDMGESEQPILGMDTMVDEIQQFLRLRREKPAEDDDREL